GAHATLLGVGLQGRRLGLDDLGAAALADQLLNCGHLITPWLWCCGVTLLYERILAARRICPSHRPHTRNLVPLVGDAVGFAARLGGPIEPTLQCARLSTKVLRTRNARP